jgi:hypothetical protein
MKFQDNIADQTKVAALEVFRYAKAVPADKVEWQPLDAGRSVLDIARELARCPAWAYDLVNGEDFPEWNEETAAKEKALTDQWTTIEACEAECLRQVERLMELYRTVSDERLAETKWLPFEGGRDYTVAEMMDYPRWNFNYHLGQIAYIQILYGDREMH